jgi:hypothetical protein
MRNLTIKEDWPINPRNGINEISESVSCIWDVWEEKALRHQTRVELKYFNDMVEEHREREREREKTIR